MYAKSGRHGQAFFLAWERDRLGRSFRGRDARAPGTHTNEIRYIWRPSQGMETIVLLLRQGTNVVGVALTRGVD